MLPDVRATCSNYVDYQLLGRFALAPKASLRICSWMSGCSEEDDLCCAGLRGHEKGHWGRVVVSDFHQIAGSLGARLAALCQGFAEIRSLLAPKTLLKQSTEEQRRELFHLWLFGPFIVCRSLNSLLDTRSSHEIRAARHRV